MPNHDLARAINLSDFPSIRLNLPQNAPCLSCEIRISAMHQVQKLVVQLTKLWITNILYVRYSHEIVSPIKMIETCVEEDTFPNANCLWARHVTRISCQYWRSLFPGNQLCIHAEMPAFLRICIRANRARIARDNGINRSHSFSTLTGMAIY